MSKVEEESVLIDCPEKAFAQNLIRMSERHLGEIDTRLTKFYKDNELLWWRRQEKKEYKNTQKKRIVLNALRLGIVQLLYFGNIPQHVALYETVEVTKRLAGPSGGRVVNAVLRNVQRDTEVMLPIDPFLNCSPFFAQQSPSILERYLLEHIHRDQIPPLDLSLLDASSLEHGQRLECGSLRTWGRAHIFSDTEHRRFWAQDAAATVAVSAFRRLPFPSHASILDACAAPGGKTLALAWSLQFRHILSVDSDEARLTLLKSNLETVGLPTNVSVTPLVSDLGQLSQAYTFDAILLDAPCSCSGTARRQPSVLRKTGFGTLLQKQAKLLASCFEHLKPGGILVYSTCSFFPEENHLQINRFLQGEHKNNIKRLPFEAAPTGFSADAITEDGDWLVLPWHLSEYDQNDPTRFDCDSHYVARLQKAGILSSSS